MRQSSLSFPSFANDCMGFFVSLWLRHEDTLRLGIKNKRVYFVLLSACCIFANRTL